MPIGFTSSCTDTVSPLSTLDCTLVFECGTHVWRMCVVCARVALARARVCMQDVTRARVKMKCKEKNGTFHVYCSYAFVCNQRIRI